MNRIFYALIVAAASLAPSLADAAIKYVRPGAAGSNSGSDWTNAYPTLPTSLTRGDTYYLAGGNYGGFTFNAVESGSTVITIKKATDADHGTSTGWLSTYGGQTVFGNIKFASSYWVLDGATRDENDWFNAAAYGFSVGSSASQNQISIQNYGRAPSNITIKYVYVPGWSAPLPSTTQRIYAIDTDDFDGGSVATNLVFHRMYVSGSNNVWFLRTTNGAIVEYSASSGVASNSANHGEIVNLYYSGNNAVIRYNQWKDAYLSSGGTALVAITQADGLQFYGNVVSNFNSSDGAVGFNGYSSSRNRVFNNTFIGGLGYNSGTAWGSGSDNLTYNNLYINCRTVNLEGTHDYNGFSDSNGRGEAHAQLNIPTSTFVNYSGGIFRLTSETSAGTPMVAPFDKDPLGNTRGADGIVTRGAFEFVTGSVATLSPPTNLSIK